MAVIPFHKVTTMPGSTQPNAFYFTENGNYAEAYLTDSDGVPKAIGNSAMINALIATALANWSGEASTVTIVPTYTALQALLPDLEANTMLLVVDASADPTVGSGSALYAYDAVAEVLYSMGSGNRKVFRLYDAQGNRHYLELNQHLELPIRLADGSMGSVPTTGVLYG